MNFNSSLQTANLSAYWPAILISSALGFLLTWGLLSGDEQGRVNLFYLLFIYLILPLSSLLISVSSMLTGKGINLVRLIAKFPSIIQNNQSIRKLRQLGIDKHWCFYQSQLSAMAFSLVSLIVFFVLLLVTDINFVWRSTILSTDDIFPFLNFIALPWSFWEQAQPNIDLLNATQDTRLLGQQKLLGHHADWWQFILAVQIFYSLAARSFLLLITAYLFQKYLKSDVETKLQSKISQAPSRLAAEETQLAVVNIISPDILINNWAGVEQGLLDKLQLFRLREDQVVSAGPHASEAERMVVERWRGEQVVIVKSWEPPLAELADFLENSHGYVFPIDWQTESEASEIKVVKLKEEHLLEWSRFISQLPAWQVFVPLTLMPEKIS